MARVTSGAWIGIAMGLALAGTGDVGAAPLWLPGMTAAAGQLPGQALRARAALGQGTECYRHGDYEQAAGLFQQAEAGKNELSDEERMQLTNSTFVNSQALQAQRLGADLVRQAEAVWRQGNKQQAAAILNGVASNRFLTASDRVRAQELGKLVGVAPAVAAMPAGPAPAAAGGEAARQKLRQARSLMAGGNYTAADALAREVAQLHATYAVDEDSPAKVLEDISRAQTDPKVLLTAARTALQQREFNRAEQLALEAEKRGPGWTFHWWTDTPAKVLKDVQVARGQAAAFGNTSAAPEQEKVREMLKEGRKALQEGNFVRAAELATTARSRKVELEWWDVDTPDKLLADVERASAGAGGQGSGSEDPHVLLKKGRALYEAGKLDDADEVAQHAAGVGSVRWGLFEDSPEKLRQDIRKERAHKDHEESVRLTAEARKLFDEGKLEEAKAKAYRAYRLHGTYNPLERGDQPTKLIAEITTAESKKRGGQPPAGGSSPKGPEGDPAIARVSATGEGPNATDPPPPSPIGPRPSETTAAVQEAHRLLAEARRLQKEGRLAEARQNALAAQKAGPAAFGPDEDRPELALIHLGSLASKRIESLVQEATDYTSAGRGDASRYVKAENDLFQARDLAVAFGLDTAPIDGKITWLGQERGRTLTASMQKPAGSPVFPVPTPAPAVPNRDQQHGQELLEKARLELRSGETGPARRLAEEAFKAHYGVQTEAEAVLRSIDAEEYEQRRLVANKTFDAGASAFNRRDFSQAGTIFRSIDLSLLEADRRARLSELMLTPELQPGAPARADVMPPPMPLERTPDRTAKAPSEPPGRAVATDNVAVKTKPMTPEESFAQQVLALQEVKFQKLRADGMKAQREATERFQAGDGDRAIDILQEYLAQLGNQELDPGRLGMLRRPVDARLQQFKMLRAQQEMVAKQTGTQDQFNKSRAREVLAERHKEEQIAELMKKYDNLYKQAKYEEARAVASAAHELDPDNTAAGIAVGMAQRQIAVTDVKRNKEGREHLFLKELNDVEDQGPALTIHDPLHIDPEISQRNKNRDYPSLRGIDIGGIKDEKEREIEHKLYMPITLDFKDESLEQVIADLRSWTGINIVPERTALDDEGVSLAHLLTMKLENVSLKSALNLLLGQVHLTYVIRDQALVITTEARARGKLVTKTYQVVDLVIPVDNNTVPNGSNLQKVIEQSTAGSRLQPSQTSLTTSGNALPGGAAPLGGASMTSTQGGLPGETPRAPGQTMEDLLIKLITNTIAPQSWTTMGGPGTIDYYPLGMALVINQTPDIQEQIADLLAALRRLQDLEIAIETRFITLSEAFYERIGLDFSMNILTKNTKYQPQIVTQQFAPPGQLNVFRPDHFVSGIQVPNTSGVGGVPTPDLGIPIAPSSFAPSIPPFGGFPNAPGLDGGLSLGLAFLSDIQVFLFLEAAQGDRRTNVMQAPKLTLFNGQTSNIQIQDQQFFVTSVNVIQSNGQIVFLPQNNAFPTGVLLTIQGIVSADRRFVRLNMAPTLTNLATPVTALFPVTTFITPVFEGGAQGQPIPFTQFIQQPNFTTVSIQTTVSVPDGGTVVLGGLKTLREGRDEFGPPVLSKIPYINRLFRNYGYGRETESLLMMVTPRIIINSEEEERQTGVTAAGPAGSAAGGAAAIGGPPPAGGTGPGG